MFSLRWISAAAPILVSLALIVSSVAGTDLNSQDLDSLEKLELKRCEEAKRLRQVSKGMPTPREIANEIRIIRSVKGSSPENVRAFWRYRAAKERSDDALRKFTEISKGLVSNTATNEQYRTAMKEKAAAWEQTNAALCALRLRPTLPLSESGIPTRAELDEQWEEAELVRRKITYLKTKHDSREDYITALRDLEARYVNHAAAPAILFALAEASDETSETAEEYYRKSASYGIKSDRWSRVQQKAWRKLAELYEKRKQYRRAVEALEGWEISEWCGTGAAGSAMLKAFKMWELRLHYEPTMSVYREMWEELQSKCITFTMGESLDGLAQRVRLLYGRERRSQLKERVAEFLDDPTLQNMEADFARFRERRFKQLVAKITSQIDDVEQAQKAYVQGGSASEEGVADIREVAVDLRPPAITEEELAPGKRVRRTLDEYKETEVYHALYLPTDWERGKLYPVIVEYAGNGPYRNKFGDVCSGKVEDCNLGYGISGGKGYIWITAPYISKDTKRNQLQWWGDVEATVEYCKTVVRRVCREYGGDPKAVVPVGFSRGAIACNYIGLHDDEIASLWRGFFCHSHYDGVRKWNYSGSDRNSAAERLTRLKNRPQFISHEISVEQTRTYLAEACPEGSFTFLALPYRNHTDSWVLRDIPERRQLREWFRDVLKDQNNRREP